MARDALHDKEAYQVIGGFLSPVCDAYEKTGLVESRHRLEMCRLAMQDSDWIAVDGWESGQSRYQRTIEVLDSLQTRLNARLSGVQVMFLAGADLVQSFRVPGLWAADDVLPCTIAFLRSHLAEKVESGDTGKVRMCCSR